MTHKPKLEDVFTPRHLARKHSFVRREPHWSQVVSSIRQGGMLFVYGPFHAGKSSTAEFASTHLRRRIIRLTCSAEWGTFSDLKANLTYAFLPSLLERIAGPIGRIVANIVGNITGTGPVFSQPTADADSMEEFNTGVDKFLRRTLGARRRKPLVICIDDLHRLHVDMVAQLVQFCKDYSESASYLLLLSGGPREVREITSAIETIPDALGRVAELKVPVWSSDDLQRVLDKGSEALNVCFEDETARRVIDVACDDIARLHALAYLCCEASGIMRRLPQTQQIKQKAFEKAIHQYYSLVDLSIVRRLHDLRANLVTAQGRALFREVLNGAERGQSISNDVVKYVRTLAEELVVKKKQDVERIIKELFLDSESILHKNTEKGVIEFRNEQGREAWSRLRSTESDSTGMNPIVRRMIEGL